MFTADVSFAAYPDSDKLIGIAGMTRPELHIGTPASLDKLPPDLENAAEAIGLCYQALSTFCAIHGRSGLERYARAYALGLGAREAQARAALQPLVAELLAVTEGRPFYWKWIGMRRGYWNKPKCHTACGALLLLARRVHLEAHGDPSSHDPCRWDLDAVEERLAFLRFSPDLTPLLRAIHDELTRLIGQRTGQPVSIALGVCGP